MKPDIDAPTVSSAVRQPLLLRWRYGAWVLATLAIVALFSHLGALPMDTHSDEARRALVSLEMILSGDYLTPTVNGIRYFNKPPLYNWLIIGSYRLFGNYSSLALRFPMALSLVLFGLTIFVFVRRYVPVQASSPHGTTTSLLSAGLVTPSVIAFAVAMMLVTNARMWLYDSLLGLIDVTFSWVTYTVFLLVYHFERRRNYWGLYLSSYALTAIGFMLKGLPSLVFEGLTLLTWFSYTRQFRRLLHPAHWAGMLLFGLLVGTYYVAYFTRNQIPLRDLASVLVDQSARRTVINYGLWPTLRHMLTYPFEMLHLFAPYTALVVLLFRAELWRVLRAEPFIAFNALTFLVNFIVYWVSPEVFARYLFPLLPLLFTVLAYLYYVQTAPSDPRRIWPERIWQAMGVILTIGCWTAVWYPETRYVPGVVWKTAISCCLLGFVTWSMFRPSFNRLGLMLALMVVVRIGYNWLVLPPRFEQRDFHRKTAERVASRTRGTPLFGFRQTIGSDRPNDVSTYQATDINSFYIAAYRQDVLRITNQKKDAAYYIADSVSLLGEQYTVIDTLTLFNHHPAYIVRFKPAATDVLK